MHNDPLVVSLRVPVKEPEREPIKIPEPTPPQKRPRFSWYFILVVLAILALGGGSAKYFGFLESVGLMQESSPQAAADEAEKAAVEKEAGDLVAEIGALILLPEGEVPTVATVSDPAKLASQVFFKNAKIGDKVLLYTKAKKAYLYRPAKHLLIEVAPITTDSTGSPQTSPQ